MTQALLYRSRQKWRLGVALGAAIAIHIAAISFANTRDAQPFTAAPSSDDGLVMVLDSASPIDDPPPALSDPPLTPPPFDQTFAEDTATPPPVRKQNMKFAPMVKPQPNRLPGPTNLSSAKVFAISAPQPEYPYEARRQKITGDGIAQMTIDPATGIVSNVSMSKTTGSPYLDNAAVTGFRRWRFKPGSATTVACPVTFTLAGVSY